MTAGPDHADQLREPCTSAGLLLVRLGNPLRSGENPSELRMGESGLPPTRDKAFALSSHLQRIATEMPEPDLIVRGYRFESGRDSTYRWVAECLPRCHE